MQFKLANIVLNPGDFLDGHEDLLYKAGGALGIASIQPATAASALAFTGAIDLLTYLNAFSLAKWRQYTSLENLFVHVELAGDDCDIALVRANENAQRQTEVLTNMYAANSWQAFDLPIALDSSVLVGLQLVSAGTTRVRNTYFYTDAAPGSIRPVRLALATTTFKKEDFILPNIERIRTEIVQGKEALAGNFHMFVIDNGQTLDAAALSGEGMTVLPNCNAGGSGGFARGMMAAQESKMNFTHIILMDDDVHIAPESFVRLYALLSLVTPEYERACLSGAMLEMENPALFFEDVSFMSARGSWERVKPSIWVNQVEGIIECEQMNTEVKNAYAGWWFCCIPMSVVEEQGLPLPFFVRLDDVEYGLRCKTKFMTMAGISIWHEGFDNRYSGVTASYQYVRNMLVVYALYNWASVRIVMLRYWHLFHIFLRTMDYASAELWLDGLEDYLKGPIYLMSRDPFEGMAAALKKAEKFVPLEELDDDVIAKLDIDTGWLNGEDTRPMLQKVLIAFPHDRHWLPRRFLRTVPSVICPDPGNNFVPWTKTAMRDCLVAITPDGKRGNIRRIDYERHAQLIKRYRSLMADYRRRGKQVAQAYRDAMPRLTSVNFWKEYLGLN